MELNPSSLGIIGKFRAIQSLARIQNLYTICQRTPIVRIMMALLSCEVFQVTL